MKFLRMDYLLDFIAVDSMGKMIISNLYIFMQAFVGGRLIYNDRKHEESLYYEALDLP